MNNSITKNIFSFIFFSLIQVLLFLNFNIYEYGFAFVYLGFIFFLPLNTPVIYVLILAFLQGIFIDLFYNTIGIHAFALVFVSYLKPKLSTLFIPKMIDDISELKSITQLGVERALLVVFLLTFTHHFILFMIINNASEFIIDNIIKTVFSSILSTFFLFSFKKIFFNQL